MIHAMPAPNIMARANSREHMEPEQSLPIVGSWRLISPPLLFFVLLIAVRVVGASQDSSASPASLAAGAFKRGDFAQAISIARQALEHGENAQLRNLLGKAYAGAGDPNAAFRELKSAVQLQPDVEQFQFDLAQFLLRSQNFQTALTVLEEAHRRLPRSAQIELALGVADYCCVRYDDAVSAFLRTMELAPDVAQPYVFLGKILEHANGHLPEIARRCTISERIYPSNSAALLLHAKVLIAEHSNAEPGEDKTSLDAAAHLLERAIALDPNSANAYFTLGCLMTDQGNFARAAELLDKSVQLNPKNPNARYRLGLLYARLGERTRADQEFAAQATLKEQAHHGPPFE
jgi:tetratricopeptide (TPR) repeat protein